MTRKFNQRIKGACRLLRLVGAGVAIIGMLSGCADTDSETAASDLNNQTQYSFQASTDCQAALTAADRDACATVLHLLKQALTDQVQLSDEDFKKIELKHNDVQDADINDAIENCNDNGYEDSYSGSLWETAETICNALGETVWPMSSMTSTDPGLGPDSHAAEIAFARACALPIVDGVREVAGGCANLSRLFEFRHQPELALAIVEYAPKCQGRPHAAPEIHPIDYVEDSANSQRESCLWQESYVLRDMGRPQAATLVYKILCDAAVEEACSDFADMGGQVNMKAVEERQASLQAAAQSRADADSAAQAQAKAERDADEQNLLNALHSLPGGSDPNAIVNTANQQVANMNALGAGNDAALQRAAEQRREQAAAQQVQGNSQQSEQSSLSSPSGTGSEYCPNVVGYTDSGIPHSKAYPDFGATCNPVRDETSCIRVVSNVWKAADPELNLVLSNACSTPVRLTVWGPPDDPEGETQNVGPGRQFTYWSQRQTWHYEADDGVDCPVDYARPGCRIVTD